MVAHFLLNEALYLLGGGRGWFPNKVKGRREQSVFLSADENVGAQNENARLCCGRARRKNADQRASTQNRIRFSVPELEILR